MITRFAPSPTGPLHLGHAYSALRAYDMARAANGALLLRIEDIDQSRARDEWETQIYDDLAWLGLKWRAPVLRQSTRAPAYTAALDLLWARGLLYPCACTRRDIATAASAPQEGAPLLGPDGVIYPGTCRPVDNVRATPRPQTGTLRLNIAAAIATLAPILSFNEAGHGTNGETGLIEIPTADLVADIGDVVLSRTSMIAAYHLAVVVDDDAQDISDVVRGADLFEATKIHILLQNLLGISPPTYHHHRLIRDDDGKRLAKRDDARAIAKMRTEGATPNDIRRLVGLPPA